MVQDEFASSRDGLNCADLFVIIVRVRCGVVGERLNSPAADKDGARSAIPLSSWRSHRGKDRAWPRVG
jgi:hypothetical protein